MSDQTVLFFDTETTGLFREKLPIGHEDQPSLVQISAELHDQNGKAILGFSTVVDPQVSIPTGASDVHGITNDYAEKFGVKTKTAVGLFRHLLMRADIICAHNAKFDIGVMKTALWRCADDTDIDAIPVYCTMEAASPIVDLPPTQRMIDAGFNKPKPPKLEECIKHFFAEDLEGAHDALIDVRACARIYRHLVKLEAENAE